MKRFSKNYFRATASEVRIANSSKNLFHVILRTLVQRTYLAEL